MMKQSARVFRALADPTRRQILQELGDGELCAGDIVARFSISAPAVSRHLSILKAAELIDERRDGARIYYRVMAERLAHCLSSFLGSVCPTQVGIRRQVAKRAKGKRT